MVARLWELFEFCRTPTLSKRGTVQFAAETEHWLQALNRCALLLFLFQLEGNSFENNAIGSGVIRHRIEWPD
jgi:hypothetical protein